ncbi:uncharacterized protein COLE_01395 [Cutaneotrichosporon oleaginosum]|uniref:uncharacterized protein n=1 Tax=Cutaneotrichosporon oleaginosum TaxID=879819 RepID=UPI0013287DE1|nr:hypothetical protein COLE_01395 [Cutaneotrichosporon oleaginosum]
MYQASDGKWYPVEHMPQGYGGGQQGYGGYGQQPQMQYGGQQPIYVQQQGRPGGAGAAAGTGAAAGLGCCAALCGMLLCFDLGACLF